MKRDIWKVITALSILGIILALYLLYNQFMVTELSGVCNINSKFNCNEIANGSLGRVLGIPVPLVGLTGYVTIFIASLKKIRKLAIFMAVFGTLFCLRITVIELFFVKVICPICLACQLNMVLISILLIFNKPQKEDAQLP